MSNAFVSLSFVLLVFFSVGKSAHAFTSASLSSGESLMRRSALPLRRGNVALHAVSSSTGTGNSLRETKKDELLNLLSCVPSNVSTPQKITSEILQAVRELEEYCPTSDEDVLVSLGGNWELIWTAQDRSSLEGNKGLIFNWIK